MFFKKKKKGSRLKFVLRISRNPSEIIGDTLGCHKKQDSVMDLGNSGIWEISWLCGATQGVGGKARKNKLSVLFTGLHLLSKGMVGNCILMRRRTSLTFPYSFRIDVFIGPYPTFRVVMKNTGSGVRKTSIPKLVLQLPSCVTLGKSLHLSVHHLTLLICKME